MFCCIRRHLHPEIWAIASVNNSTKTGCFICLLNQLSDKSVTCVQKQVALQIIVTLFDDENGSIWSACRQTPSIGFQIIDTAADLQADEPLQDVIVTVCTSTVDKLMKQDGYKHLLTKFIEGIHHVNEMSIQFCMNVVSSLLSLNPVYVELLLISYDDVVPPLLEKAEYMDEKMTVSLILMLIPLVKHVNCLADRGGYGTMLTHVVPLINTWLNTSQSLGLKKSVLMLLRELSQQRAPVLSLLSFGDANRCGDNNVTLSQTFTPPDHPFLMGLKRMMTCKEAELTFYCVQCLTQVLQTVQEPQYITCIMASDLPASFSCLDAMMNGDDFFQRCHAVYGIDATIKAVTEALNSQKLSSAISGLHLLWCLLDRQPETIPLLLNNTWGSCYQLICQTLQNGNNSIFMTGLQLTASFLRPHHQQTPVDIQAILSLICMVESKSQTLLNRQEPLGSNSASKSENEIHSIVLNSAMDILIHVISLFQRDVIFQGNDRQRALELKHVIQSVATDFIVTKKFFTHAIRSSETVDKYMKCVDATIFIQLFIPDSETRSQSSTLTDSRKFFIFLMKSGMPWHILGFSSTVRCPSLEERAAKLVTHILSNCLESLPSALHIDPEQLYLGLVRLEWTEVGLSLECIPSDKNALLTELVTCYCSYLYGYRPWPLDQLFYFLCEIFHQFPSYLSWHPMMLRSTIYFLAKSEDVLQDIDTNSSMLKYEAAVIAELEKTSLDLWYSDCFEILSWTLSSHTRHAAVGNKTVEYWIHQLTLKENGKEEMKTFTLYLKDCLPFYQSIIDLLSSNTAGKMANSVLIQSLHDEPTASSKEMILQWSHKKLEHAFSLTMDTSDAVVDNILSVLHVLIDGNTFESNVSYLHSVKVICQCAKYLTQQEMESNTMVNALRYLSVLVKKLTIRESKIVIPPLMQNTKIVAMLQSALSKSSTTTLSHLLTLCVWLSTRGIDYQAAIPLIITSEQILSWLASCQPVDASAVLLLVKSALTLSKAQSGKITCGSVRFVKGCHTYLSTHQVFNDPEILRIYWYAMQYLVQDTLPEKQIAFDIMEIIMTVNPGIASQCVNNPWNSLLMEDVFTMKADDSLSQLDLDICMLISASNDIWTTTSANSFLLALTSTSLESISISDVRTILSRLKQRTGVCDPILFSEIEKKLDLAIGQRQS